MDKKPETFMQTAASLITTTKAYYSKHTLKEWIKISKEQIVELYNDIKLKTKDLKKTNIELALYHFYKGNFSDAKFRFKFVKFFWPDVSEVNYFLGRIYFYEKGLDKAKTYFSKYLESSDQKFVIETQYCLNRIEEHNDLITEIPLSIIKENFDIFANGYNDAISGSNELSPQDLLTHSVLKFVNSIGKPAINKVLDLGCGTGLLGISLKSKVNISFLSGIDLSKAMLAHAKMLNIDKVRVYDELLQLNAEDYLSTLNSNENFDIVLAHGIFNFYPKLPKIIELLSTKVMGKNALFAFSLRTHDHTLLKSYQSDFEEFSFSVPAVLDLLKEFNFNVLHQQDLELKNKSKGVLVIAQKN